MDSLNISNIQRRKPRRSMLGTHRGYSIGFQHNEDPTPQTIEEVDSHTDSLSVSVTNMNRRLPRKSMLGTRNIRRESFFSVLPETSFSSTTNVNVNVDTDKAVKKVDDANDSFEENETFMMANENEESVLATTLLDNTIVEMASGIPQMENDTTTHSVNDNSILDVTVMKIEVEDPVLTDTINHLNLIIENNTRSINRYSKQIDEIQKEIEEKNRQTEEIINLKCRLMKKFNLSESPNQAQAETGKSREQRKSKPRKCKPVISDQKENVESPNQSNASKKVFRELRSSFNFIKTPRRSSRRLRSSTILTPHSMSFTIKSQLEQLLE